MAEIRSYQLRSGTGGEFHEWLTRPIEFIAATFDAQVLEHILTHPDPAARAPLRPSARPPLLLQAQKTPVREMAVDSAMADPEYVDSRRARPVEEASFVCDERGKAYD